MADAGSTPGDLIIKIHVKPDPYFRRDGFDIYSDCKLSVSEVLSEPVLV